jgi:hypothetical protein
MTRKPLRVVFINEEAIDEGGVRKEFFQLLVTQLLSLQYGMFVPTSDQRALWINQTCTWSAEEYRLVVVMYTHRYVIFSYQYDRRILI